MYLLKEYSIIFVFFAVVYSSCAEDVCLSDKNGDCGTSTKENKYTKGLRNASLELEQIVIVVFLETNGKYDFYIQQVEKAKEEYVACNITNCQCYLPVIINDLKTFKSGITRKLIDNIKSK